VPQPTKLTQPFWDGCREHILLVQQCATCHHFVFVPQEFCPTCRSLQLQWVEARGHGEIVTFTTVWRAQTPAFESPYVVAVVRLDEGYEMLTNIVDTALSDVRIEARVTVRFLDLPGGVTLPCFRVGEL
jgi:uncharacterized OB-fold protein